jgi:hypothetical protein
MRFLLLISMVFSLPALACELSPQEFDAAIKQRLKFFAVYENESDILNSVLDEREIKAAARKKHPASACLQKALALAKAGKLPDDSELRELLGAVFCSSIDSVALTFNIHTQRGLATFVRSFPRQFKEISLGSPPIGPEAANAEGCEATFWKGAKHALAQSKQVAEKVRTATPEERANPDQLIRDALEQIFRLGPITQKLTQTKDCP